MPPIKPVPSLFDTALRCYGKHSVLSLAGLLILQVEASGDDKVSFHRKKDSLLSEARAYTFRHTVSTTNNELFKFIVDEILGWQLVDMNKLSVLPSKLTTKNIDTSVWKLLEYFVVIHGNEGLKELDFSYRLGKQTLIISCEMATILSRTLFKNPSWSNCLVSLKLPYMSNSKIVKLVGSHCHNLQYLDITACNVDIQHGRSNFACLSYLHGAVENRKAGCPKLKVIFLPKAENEDEHEELVDHVVKMMRFMPNLHIIRNVDTRLVAIEYMKIVGPSDTMKLTEFEEWYKDRCRGGDYKKVNKALGKLFPNVWRYASHNGNGFKNGFRTLQVNFPNLQVIEVCGYQTNTLKDIQLIDPMPSVKIFKLSEIHKRLSIRKIQIVSDKFPNLEKLSLNVASYLRSVNYYVEVGTFFPNLRFLELSRVGKKFDVRFLQTFLKTCCSLKILELNCTDPVYLEQESVTDEFFRPLITHMVNLERLNITQDFYANPAYHGIIILSLSYSLARFIVQSCPNLRYLGDLAVWDIDEPKYWALKRYAERKNFDINIRRTPCGKEEDDDSGDD